MSHRESEYVFKHDVVGREFLLPGDCCVLLLLFVQPLLEVIRHQG